MSKDDILAERLINFAHRLQNPKVAVDTLMGDEEMVAAANAVLGDGFYGIWMLMLGAEGAMKVAFLMGAAWQKEVSSLDNPKLNDLLSDVNLGD